jgi:hypothetical protein
MRGTAAEDMEAEDTTGTADMEAGAEAATAGAETIEDA